MWLQPRKCVSKTIKIKAQVEPVKSIRAMHSTALLCGLLHKTRLATISVIVSSIGYSSFFSQATEAVKEPFNTRGSAQNVDQQRHLVSRCVPEAVWIHQSDTTVDTKASSICPILLHIMFLFFLKNSTTSLFRKYLRKMESLLRSKAESTHSSSHASALTPKNKQPSGISVLV